MSLSSRWPIVSIGEVVDNKDSKRVPLKQADRAARQGEYPYYGASGIIDYVDEYLFEGPHLLIGEDGANLLARSTPIAFMATGKFWVNNHAHVLGATDKIDLKYLEYFFATLELESYVTGSAQPKLNRKNLDRIPIPLPPLAEQRRIAAILEKADAIRRKRKLAIQYTEELLRATFLDMFGDPVTNPKGWKIVKMEQVIRETQYGTAEKSNEDGQGLPVLRMNNITYSGEIILDSLKWCQISPKDEEKFTVRRGDLLFNRTNSPELVGKTAIWRSDETFAFAGYLIRVRFDEEKVLPEYASAYLNSAHGKRYLLERAKPSINMSNFSASEFLKIPILLPDIKFQRHFTEFSNSTRQMATRLSSETREYDNLFNSLLQRAFRGEL